jgi:2-dehydropantoate 2-reductase
MKISVVGAGALGTFYAAMLKASSQDVTLVCRERDVAALQNGVSVTGAFDVCARPQVSAEPVPSDLVIVAVKSRDVPTAAEGLQLNPGGIAVIIHNGLGADEAAAAVLGPGRVATGISYSGVTFLAPGKVRANGYTETVLGAAGAGARARLNLPLAALMAAGLHARVADDIRAAQWDKLYVNVAISGIAAITGLPNGRILEVPGLKVLAAAAVTEAAAVAAVSGVRPSADPVEQAYRVLRDNPDSRSSMLQDIVKGRQTEIDAINGKICEIGRLHGVPTPANDTITALVKGIEKRNGC